jgi:peptidoglycan biosynthesis protein MviN/MurJ (putative lipid II flippase)
MIQRIQSVWLLLAALCGFAFTQVPYFFVNLANNITRKVLATENLLLFALSIALACLAAACIFIFRNRKLQFKLTVTGVLLSIGLIALSVMTYGNYPATDVLAKGWYWGGLLPIAMTIFFMLAARGIYKDEKLIKSLDRLR